MEQKFTMPGFEDVEAGIVHWPMSVSTSVAVKIRTA